MDLFPFSGEDIMSSSIMNSVQWTKPGHSEALSNTIYYYYYYYLLTVYEIIYKRVRNFMVNILNKYENM
jgi:hypothetical protein